MNSATGQPPNEMDGGENAADGEVWANGVLEEVTGMIDEAVRGLGDVRAGDAETVVRGGFPFVVVGARRRPVEVGRVVEVRDGPIRLVGRDVVFYHEADGVVAVDEDTDLRVAGGNFVMTVGGEGFEDGMAVGRDLLTTDFDEGGFLFWKYTLTLGLEPLVPGSENDKWVVTFAAEVDLEVHESVPVSVLPVGTLEGATDLEIGVGSAGGVLYQMCARFTKAREVTIYQLEPAVLWVGDKGGWCNAPFFNVSV